MENLKSWLAHPVTADMLDGALILVGVLFAAKLIAIEVVNEQDRRERRRERRRADA